MARIPLPPVDELDPFLRDLHDNARDDDWSTKHCARAFASHPRLLERYLDFYYPYHSEGRLPLRLKELVRLRIATLNGCETCKAARLAQEDLTELEVLAVDGYQVADYSDREKLAIRYAETMAVDHHSIDDSFLREIREEFDEAEFLELTMMAGQYIGFGRMLAILQLETVACPI